MQDVSFSHGFLKWSEVYSFLHYMQGFCFLQFFLLQYMCLRKFPIKPSHQCFNESCIRGSIFIFQRTRLKNPPCIGLTSLKCSAAILMDSSLEIWWCCKKVSSSSTQALVEQVGEPLKVNRRNPPTLCCFLLLTLILKNSRKVI